MQHIVSGGRKDDAKDQISMLFCRQRLHNKNHMHYAAKGKTKLPVLPSSTPPLPTTLFCADVMIPYRSQILEVIPYPPSKFL